MATNVDDLQVNIIYRKRKNISIELKQERNTALEYLSPFTMDEIKKLADKALVVIPERVRRYAPIVGVTYVRITIRN